MKKILTKILQTNSALLALILLSIVLSIAAPNFLTFVNISNILKNATIIGIISCGLTLVVVGGGLDLSVGSALSLIGVVSVILQPRSLILAILIPLVLAVIIGFSNGLIVSLIEINSIIVTLGSLSILGGLALVVSKGAVLLAIPNKYYSFLGNGTFLNIPLYIYIFIFVAIFCELLLKKTLFGKKLLFVGSNYEAAKAAGVNVVFVRTVSFIICSLLVAVSAIMLSSRMTSASPLAGVGYEFDALTAIVIGGVSLKGGKGNIYNTVIGALLLGVITNALNLFNVFFAFQNIAKGVLIIIAIFADTRTQREQY